MTEPSSADQPQDAQTLTDLLSLYEARGFTGQMAARDGGRVVCFTCHQESPAGEMRLRDLRRTEGVSDPDDMLAVAALECPRCGAKGTATLNYGPLSTLEDADVLRLLDDAGRQMPGGRREADG